jgi:hypothetical protein
LRKDKPTRLKITEEQWKGLKQAIINGIKSKLLATRKMIEIDKEIAAGIHVYSLEELGKLSLLESAPKEDNYRIINYSREFMSHGSKFERLADYLKREGQTECNEISKGGYTSRSFSQDGFTMDTFADTQARLGVFYTDLDYSSDSDIAKGIKKIPSVDSDTLRKAVDCLQNIIDEWQS